MFNPFDNLKVTTRRPSYKEHNPLCWSVSASVVVLWESPLGKETIVPIRLRASHAGFYFENVSGCGQVDKWAWQLAGMTEWTAADVHFANTLLKLFGSLCPGVRRRRRSRSPEIPGSIPIPLALAHARAGRGANQYAVVCRHYWDLCPPPSQGPLNWRTTFFLAGVSTEALESH